MIPATVLRLGRVIVLVVVPLMLMAVPNSWAGPNYKVLHAFGTGTDGGGLWSPVVLDRHGNVYGTTSGGGLYGAGTVFQLTPQTTGAWSEAIIHNFSPSPSRNGDWWRKLT
jgi:uncharacterized repeat protein (TIGR03803 family)